MAPPTPRNKVGAINDFGVLDDGVYIKPSSIPEAGMGLYIDRDVEKNGLITEYFGEYITHEEAHALRDQDLDSHVRVVSSFHLCIDGIREPVPGLGAASFANDARNLKINNAVFVTKHDPKLAKDRVFLKAKRFIPKDTEVFVGYGTTYWKIRDMPPHVMLQPPAHEQQAPQAVAPSAAQAAAGQGSPAQHQQEAQAVAPLAAQAVAHPAAQVVASPAAQAAAAGQGGPAVAQQAPQAVAPLAAQAAAAASQGSPAHVMQDGSPADVPQDGSPMVLQEGSPAAMVQDNSPIDQQTPQHVHQTPEQDSGTSDDEDDNDPEPSAGSLALTYSYSEEGGKRRLTVCPTPIPMQQPAESLPVTPHSSTAGLT